MEKSEWTKLRFRFIERVKSNALGFAFACADALLMCLLVMSLNLFFLMHASCESYGPDVCFL